MNTFYDAVTEFIFMDDEPQPADVIFVPGSSLPDHALRAAQLFHEGYAPFILPSGKYSKLAGKFAPEPGAIRPGAVPGDRAACGDESLPGETDAGASVPRGRSGGAEEQAFCRTEWEYLHQVLRQAGVPEEAILKEDRATFTWENAIFSRQVLKKAQLPCRRAILCCQAFHARRAWMYYRQQFPETDILVVPVVTKEISRDNWYLSKRKTDVVLGEVSRIGEQFHCCLPLI